MEFFWIFPAIVVLAAIIVAISLSRESRRWKKLNIFKEPDTERFERKYQ